MSKDLGQEVIDFMFEQLQIDEKWSIREERGFKWWAGPLAQSVTVEEGNAQLVSLVVNDGAEMLISAFKSRRSISGPELAE